MGSRAEGGRRGDESRERGLTNEIEGRRREETREGVFSIVKAARLSPPRVPSRPSRPFIKLRPLILSIPPFNVSPVSREYRVIWTTRNDDTRNTNDFLSL